MIFSNKTELFLVKRSVVIILLIVILTLIVFGSNYSIVLGLLVGYLVSLIRLRALSYTVENVVKYAKKQVNSKSPFKYILVQLITITVLVLAIKKSAVFFLATFCGVLVIPLTILINSISELTGITKNNFE